MTLHTYNKCLCHVSSSYTLCTNLKGKVHYTKVKSRSHHDIAHLPPPHPHPHPNVPTKYQLPTPYSFQDTAQTIFYRSRSLLQDQRLNYGHTMALHTYNTPHPPSQCPYQVSTSYTLWFLRYSLGKILFNVAPARSKVKSRVTP